MDPMTAGWALTVAIFLPLVGSGALAMMPASRDREIRWAAVAITGVAFAIVAVITASFDFTNAGELQFVTDDVTRVDFSERPFRIYVGGDEHLAETVIVATGASARQLGLESEQALQGRGVSYCATCDGAFFRDKELAVVGGGDSAMEESTYLAKFASKVYIVHRRDEFRASKIMADRALSNEKIDVKWNSVVDEVLGDDEQGVTGVRIRGTVEKERTEELAASGYFAAIGHTANTDFLKGQVKTNDKGYIIWTTPFRTYTSVEGVFAAGDVADDYYRQAITSAGTGCMAALDAERYLAHAEH